MKITYDPVVDALYIKLEDTEDSNDVVIDYDLYDRVLGIEVINFSKLCPELLKGIAQNVSRT